MNKKEKFFDWITGGKSSYPFLKSMPTIKMPVRTRTEAPTASKTPLSAEDECRLEGMNEVEGRKLDDARDQKGKEIK